MNTPGTKAAPQAIRVHIEKLVLEGLPLQRSQTGCLQLALVEELERLISADALSPTADITLTRVSGAPLRMTFGTPRSLGEGLAHSVQSALQVVGSSGQTSALGEKQ